MDAKFIEIGGTVINLNAVTYVHRDKWYETHTVIGFVTGTDLVVDAHIDYVRKVIKGGNNE